LTYHYFVTVKYVLCCMYASLVPVCSIWNASRRD